MPGYFNGELMVCCVCGAVERSDPQLESNWRMIEAAGEPYYACPREFPEDGAPAQAFEGAYRRVMLHITSLHNTRPGVHHVQ